MKQAQAEAALVALRDQLTKVKTEIVTKIDALVAAAADVETTPTFDAALAEIKTISDSLDAIVPDEVPPVPPS